MRGGRGRDTRASDGRFGSTPHNSTLENTMRVLCVASVLLQSFLWERAEGHGSMIMPPSRNSVDADLPAWSHGKFPETGTIEPYAPPLSSSP